MLLSPSYFLNPKENGAHLKMPRLPPSSPVKMFKNQRNPYIQENLHAIQEPKLGKNEDSKEPGVQEGRKGT